MPKDEGRGASASAHCIIIDDEPGIRHFLALVAQRAGFSAEVYGGVREAINYARAPDIVFLDLSLHQSDAVEMMRALHDRGYSGKVQLMSGTYRSLIDKVRTIGENLGLDMLPGLAKPFAAQTALDILENIRGARPDTRPRRETTPAPVLDLGTALEAGLAEFWFQPKVQLSNGLIAGFEALVRVVQRDGKIVLPAAFVPEADAETLNRLTILALDRSFAFGKELAAAGLDLPISVNMPVSALLALDVTSLVREHGDRRPRIILEITEDQITSDFDAVVEAATRLRLNGVSLSIDDFGHAYSSIARLKSLPVSEVKIDGTFVNGCATERSNAIICESIVNLARQFGMSVCAEGIQNEADLAMLQSLKVEFGQGFLFAAAMPAAELLDGRNLLQPYARRHEAAARSRG